MEAPWRTACDFHTMQMKDLNLGDTVTFSTFTVLLEILIETGENNVTKYLAGLYPRMTLGSLSQYIKYLKIVTPYFKLITT